VTDEVVVVFQNCVNLMELVPGSHSEPCHDVNFVDVKVEEVTDLQEEEEEEKDPLAVTCQVIKTECEVSFMSVCPLLGTFLRYIDVLVLPFVPYM
jgi:hypothetical protein